MSVLLHSLSRLGLRGVTGLGRKLKVVPILWGCRMSVTVLETFMLLTLWS